MNDFFLIDYSNKESKDLFSKYMLENREFIYLKYLEWDTDFFKRPSFSLVIDKSNFYPNDDLIQVLLNDFKDSFISVKIDTQIDFKYVNFLQESGFSYIDTEVQLKYREKEENIHTNEDVKIEKLDVNKNIPHDRLGRSFNLTRFHTDLNISNDMANKLWVEYLKNFIPSHNKYLYVAKINNEVTATALVNIIGDRAYLFFIAVLEECRSFGIGKQLISNIIADFKGCKIETGTQVKNTKALNFYLKNGFFIKGSSTILHRWNFE